jgi:transposase
MKGTGGYGADLARHLARHLADELVVELDPPKRPARRAGATSDPIDAERAARDTGPLQAGQAQDRCRAGRAADAPDRTTRRHPRRRHRSGSRRR